jgi:hypothetical protein
VKIDTIDPAYTVGDGNGQAKASSEAGKSTLAVRLGEITGLPVGMSNIRSFARSVKADKESRSCQTYRLQINSTNRSRP